MSKSVAVPLRLLEDIFRLLEHLDDLDELGYWKYGKRLYADDTAFWELKMKIRQLPFVEAYLLMAGDVTEGEASALRDWIAAGNGFYDNPYSLSDAAGRPMDFISACRVAFEMGADPSSFFREEPDSAADGGWDDDLPF